MDINIIQSQIKRLINLLESPDVDITWSNYDNSQQVISEIQKIEKGILNRDIKLIENMKFLLAPTGDLQEISISSGWGDEFLEIADTIENALDS